jgi:hypothetical protein
MGRRQCELYDCSKWAQCGGTPFCKAHGGSKRCQEEDCTKSAAGGGTCYTGLREPCWQTKKTLGGGADLYRGLKERPSRGPLLHRTSCFVTLG